MNQYNRIKDLNEAIDDDSYNFSFQGQVATVTTTSISLVFTGTGVIFTPKTSGNVRIIFDAYISNNTTGNGVIFNINYDKGSSLMLFGTEAAGTGVLPNAIPYTPLVASGVIPLHIDSKLTGLTLNTQYTFQPVFAAITGGIALLTQQSISVMEYNGFHSNNK